MCDRHRKHHHLESYLDVGPVTGLNACAEAMKATKATVDDSFIVDVYFFGYGLVSERFSYR